MKDVAKLKYKINYNAVFYNFKTKRYESKKQYISIMNKQEQINGNAKNVRSWLQILKN